MIDSATASKADTACRVSHGANAPAIFGQDRMGVSPCLPNTHFRVGTCVPNSRQVYGEGLIRDELRASDNPIMSSEVPNEKLWHVVVVVCGK